MGGAGGYTCMSPDAQEQIQEYMAHYETWDNHRRELNIQETQQATRAMALQHAGLIPLHSDPEWILVCLEEVVVESLRSKGTDER